MDLSLYTTIVFTVFLPYSISAWVILGWRGIEADLVSVAKFSGYNAVIASRDMDEGSGGGCTLAFKDGTEVDSNV